MAITLDTLSKLIDETMLRDRRRLRTWWQTIAEAVRAGRGMSIQMARLAGEAARSAEVRRHRLEGIPKPQYPSQLPVVEKRADIARAIAENQVVIICGETGSGKTTQLPKICLELGRGVAGLIGHTQPRRIAARTVAARIAQELRSTLGHAVGYKVRFNEVVTPRSYIKLMTDGILLAETQGDRLLEHYDTIIIDEAHERSLNIDFLLGYLKQLLPQRPDLKVVITSATIDPERFSRHFDGAPIIEVSGRIYPVETRYRPIVVEEEDEEDPNLMQAIVAAVDELAELAPGDVLIFLSGEREIRETADALKKHHLPRTEILPLFARLSVYEQNRIFQPHAGRRIVLATNVAETSLTVPGIKYVIDPGFARISRYSARTRVQRLPIERISQASANQRQGRCGRVSAGVCIRLYSEEDYESRALFMEPEIQRTNLASVILQMKALRLGKVEEFPFIDPPDGRMIRDGYQTLQELAAVDENLELTPIGKQLAKLPTDPRIGRMILAGATEGCLKELLIIAAALSVQDPRERPLDMQEAADTAHLAFRDPQSYFLSFLKLWQWYHDQVHTHSSNQLRKVCKEHFVSHLRMREWHDVHKQVHELAAEMAMPLNRHAADPDAIHRAVLAGLLGNVGYKSEGHEYAGPRGRKFSIFPGSALFKHEPPWLMAAELVETTRLYARTVAPVKPSWVEKVGQHLIQYAYTELRWDGQHARVEADERVSLFGMVLVPKRPVHYGPINPDAAREIFIRFALVEGDYRSNAEFLRHNRDLFNQARMLEAKTRRHDLIVDSPTRYAFYHARIPAGINTGPRFDRWRREAEAENPTLLHMQWTDLLRPGIEPISAIGYPDVLQIGEMQLPLTYKFEPGEPDDGLTLTIPLAVLSQLEPGRFEWLVPGMLMEKITALIKSLPSGLRRSFVPVPQFAMAAHEALSASTALRQESLLDALAAQLGKFSGMEITRNDWRLDTLPAWLFMNFRVVDDRGNDISLSRDLAALQQKLAPQVTGAFSKIEHPAFSRARITEWDFGDLPERVEVRRRNMKLYGYPALVDETASVALRLLDSPESAADAMQGGLIRLFMLRLDADFRYLGHGFFPDLNEMAVHYAIIGGASEMKNDLLQLIAARTFLAEGAAIRTRAEFERRREEGRTRLFDVAGEVKKVIQQILEIYHAITLDLERPQPADWTEAIFDIQEQLKHLMPRHFIAHTPYEWLVHIPRYLQAIQLRLGRLRSGNLIRDARSAKEVEAAWRNYAQRHERHREHHIHDPELVRYRWMIEELRVSLFAQELSTAVPISTKRLEKQFGLVKR